MPLVPISGASPAEPAPWQVIAANGPGIDVVFPKSDSPDALPVVTIRIAPDPRATSPQPAKISTSGTDRESITVTVEDTAGKSRAGHVFAVDLVMDAVRNELGRNDLSDVQRDQLCSLLTATGYLRQRTKLTEDPEGVAAASAFSRYIDTSKAAAQQGSSVPVLDFFTP
jgi:hypothetical protein